MAIHEASATAVDITVYSSHTRTAVRFSAASETTSGSHGLYLVEKHDARRLYASPLKQPPHLSLALADVLGHELRSLPTTPANVDSIVSRNYDKDDDNNTEKENDRDR